MKKLLAFAVALAGSLAVFAGTPVTEAQLPQTARTFISTTFPGDNVAKAEKDRGIAGTEYEVDLRSGVELEFTHNGEWKEIKAARGMAVPAAVVPEAIATYVTSNHPGTTIKEIKKKRGYYEIELNNDHELYLNDAGRPVAHMPWQR